MLRTVLILLAFTAGAVDSACSYDDSGLTDWSSSDSWADGAVPKDGDIAIIKSGKHVRLNASPTLKGVEIESGGSLIWGNLDGLVLTTDYVYVNGSFIIGDSDCPFTKKANIKLTGLSHDTIKYEEFGKKFIGCNTCTLEFHGAVKKSWTKLIQSIPAAEDTCGLVFNLKDTEYYGETGQGLFVLAFNQDGSVFDFGIFETQDSTETDAENNFKAFVEGDEIVVVTTDFDPEQTEEFTIVDCDDCAVNEVRLDHAFEYPHYGEVTQGVDERGEVGMLTQSIKIEGVMEDECYHNGDEKAEWLCGIMDNKDTHGGHLKILKDFKAAHIEHVELKNMGQQQFVGSYALHFHMCGDVEGNWFRYNSIHHIHSRCVTIHGTDKAEITGNVCYLTKGHSFFIEDSCEQENIFDSNLGIGTSNGIHLLTDMHRDWVNDTFDPFVQALSTFWITHPNNYIRNNVAAGSKDVGFMYTVSITPIGVCKDDEEAMKRVPRYHAFHTPIAQFDNNTAHSCLGRSLRVDSRISVGEYEDDIWVPENGMFGQSTSHVPRDPPLPNGTLITSYMHRFTAYKNRVQNVWTKSGNLVMKEFSLADTPRGIAMSRSNEGETYTEITKSLFIGESDNIGVPKEPWGRSYVGDAESALQGVKFYQGTGYVTDSFFDKFTHRYAEGGIFRPGAAVSFKQDTPYPPYPASGVTNITYGFCDGGDTNWVFEGNETLRGFGNRDGNRMASFRDYDGSITGTANTQVVNTHRFHTTDRCYNMPNWGGLAMCPYDYARVVFGGRGGSFEKENRDWGVYLSRDDRPEDIFAVQSETEDSYLVMKNMSYMVFFNGTTPDKFEVRGESLEYHDYVRVGFCLPTDAEFKFISDLPLIDDDNPAFPVDSIEKLDKDMTGRAYFWDSTIGILFLKVVGYSNRITKENCPGEACVNMKVVLESETRGVYTCDSAYDTYKRDEDTEATIPKPPKCTTGTYEGYGAPVEANRYPSETFNPTCVSPPTNPDFDYKGCFLDKASYPDVTFNPTTLSRSMTIEFCIRRCTEYNRAYAALKNGGGCTCGDFYGAYDSTPDDCTKVCGGNDDQMCGGSNRISVYSTGVAPPADLATCGPDNEGAEINDKCYYLTPAEGNYVDGQRACVKLGGNLATITSSDIQSKVEQYMRPKKVSAWFGLNDVTEESSLVYMDGTDVGSYRNIIAKQGTDPDQDGFIVSADSLYAWDDKLITNKFRALCELPKNAEVPSADSCGTDGHGKKFDSGLCLAVSNTALSKADAEYFCYTRLGSLVTVTDTNKDDVLKHIYMFGESINYWTGETNSNGDSYELTHSTVYGKESTSSTSTRGVICAIDTLSTSKPCSDEWEELSEEKMCYLYTSRNVGNYNEALELCKQGSSGILISSSEAINNFVSEMTGESVNVFIGLKYTSSSKSWAWDDGTPYEWNNWHNNHGDDKFKNGKCARVKNTDTYWRNRDCDKGGYFVCQTKSGA